MLPFGRAKRQPHATGVRRGGRTLVVLSLVALASLLAPERARANHLKGATSPYLLQHADNPVDWYPWGEEALARARREDRPIFLSIGYSACHWCHVMERESFSDPEIAALLNASFVAIKVDREERPDLDAIYMSAVLVSTGSGGWPMSVFLTPDLKPFQGGTYYPRDRFRDLLRSVASAWKMRRADVLAAAESTSRAVADLQAVPGDGRGDDRDADLLAPAAAAIEKTYDQVNGGFGQAPKFPPHGALALLTRAALERGDREAMTMVLGTLTAMARGGIYDQVGGGFHRYAIDPAWRTPHFEKTLYDNALLVPIYLMAWKASGRDDLREVAERTLAWVTRDMTDSGGGFLATIDADSEGEEGRYYTWTIGEIRAAVGRDADRVESYFGATAKGDLPGGRNILHVPHSIEGFAAHERVDAADWRKSLDAARARMLRARATRPRPRRDDKVLTAWNGLMISAFAVAHRATGRPEYLATARRAATFALRHLRARDGSPLVSWRDGTPGGPGLLDDTAFLVRGLLDLQATDHDPAWLEAATALARDATRFADPVGGWFFAPERKDLITRPLVLNDQALPSGNAIMVENLARLARLTGDLGTLTMANRAVDRAATVMRASPASYPYMILARDTLRAAVAAPAKGPGSAIAMAAEAATAGPETVAESAPPPSVPPQADPSPPPRDVAGTLVGRGSKERVVEAHLRIPADAARPGAVLEVPVVIDIRKGWHVNSSKPTLDYLIPTRLSFTTGAGFTVEGVEYPEGRMEKLQFAEERLSVYEDQVTLRARLRVARDAAQGSIDAVARLSYQACSEKACLAPETVEFKAAFAVRGEAVPVAGASDRPFTGVPGSAATAATTPVSDRRIEGQDQLTVLLRERGLLFVMGFVFLGGLALTLTPCVYPMIPVTLGYFSNQAAGTGWGRRVALPALYVLGMALTYSILGVIAGMTGGLFGAALQSPVVVVGMILLFIAMALWMFGVYELRLPGALTRLGSGRAGAVGALLMGLTLGLVAAPCIGPFIVTLLAFVGASGSAWLGFWLFFVLALGMGLPFLVLGTFSGMLATLPRSGVWLIYAKKVMGVGLLAVALYFMQPFLSDRVLGWTAIGLAAAAGLYLAWLERSKMRAAWFVPLRIGIGALVVAAGLWLALPLVRTRPQPHWQPYSDETIARAREEGRPVLIDFFAVWCAPCRELDRSTYSDPGVLTELQRFVLVKADLTSDASPVVQGLRDRFEVFGVPTVVLLDRQGTESKDLRLTGFEPPGPFLERLRRIP